MDFHANSVRFGNHAAGYLPNMVHIPGQQDNDDMNMAELAESARAVGIFSTAHMSKAELIEAVRQQRETDAVLRAEGPRTDNRGSGNQGSGNQGSGKQRTAGRGTGEGRTGERAGDVPVQTAERRLTGGVTG
ncbi:hypothetical protein GCM10009676_14290 [Prauserella halophila]|uniref:Rho termination factor N-terminal domain-containing protein n=1 Tax=Prauserella halophila TaxID=185641 RepID=A0ABN1W2D5_9PSEU|nr:Rho termination factor N-terminal domain-containing protein [Prauserella halophila]MCP2236359.1 hypothetical protein [Prauserella halophila]